MESEGPPGVVTVMVAGPAAWGGLVTVICVPESEVGETMVPPKLTGGAAQVGPADRDCRPACCAPAVRGEEAEDRRRGTAFCR